MQRAEHLNLSLIHVSIKFSYDVLPGHNYSDIRALHGGSDSTYAMKMKCRHCCRERATRTDHVADSRTFSLLPEEVRSDLWRGGRSEK